MGSGIKHKTLAAGTKINTSAVWAQEHTIDGQTIVAADIADNAITTNKILDGAVTSAKIAVDTVLAVDIATGAVGSDELATDAVTNIKMADNSVGTAELIASSVTTPKMNMNNEFTNIGLLQPYFVKDGYHQDGIICPRGWYDATSDKTYIAYERGADLDIYVIYYDHALQVWSLPVYVADNTGSADYHYAPCIVMDNNGYLHVYFGIHVSTNLKHSKSNAARDISAWTAQANVVLSASSSYPHVVKAGTNFYLFYRGPDVGGLAYRMSNDNMASFGAVTQIADMGYDPATGFAMYTSDLKYDPVAGNIHFVWYLYDYAQVKNTNIYHAYYNIANGHVYGCDATDYGTLLTKAEADAGVCLVLNSGANWAWGPRLILHPTDSYRPYILYTNGGATPATDSHFEFKKWTGAAFSAAVDVASGLDGYAQWGDWVLSGTTLRAYLNMPLTNADAELDWMLSIALYTSTDSGATWGLKEVVMSSREAGYMLYNPQCIENADTDLEVFFEQHFDYFGADTYGVNLRLYAAGQNGIVYNRLKW